jgi:Tfp pilus assembly protein PilF
LSPAATRSVFGTFESVNDELMYCVLDLPAGAKIPCVFKPQDQAASVATNAVDHAIAALNAGQFAQAEQVIQQVLQQEPGDPQAEFVARIINREKQARPATP